MKEKKTLYIFHSEMNRKLTITRQTPTQISRSSLPSPALSHGTAYISEVYYKSEEYTRPKHREKHRGKHKELSIPSISFIYFVNFLNKNK